LTAYESTFAGGVRVAAGDFNRDGVPDIITGPAHDGGLVKVFSGSGGALLRSFFPFGPLFRGGVSVAGGDVDGDGYPDILTGMASGGSQLKVLSGRDLALLHSFIAYDPSFTGGILVGAGDVTGDGRADLLTGAGAGSSLVKIFDGVRGGQLRGFIAYDPSVHGVNVRAGDVNGDGVLDIITGPGSGAAPVKVIDGTRLKQVPRSSGPLGDDVLLGSFFAFDPAFQSGVRVAVGDLDGNGRAEIAAVPGPGKAGELAVFTFSGGFNVSSRTAISTSLNGYNGGVGVSTGVPHPHGRDATPLKLSGAGQLQLDPATLAGTFTASGQSTLLGHWTN
jgi:hypothetical protein